MKHRLRRMVRKMTNPQAWGDVPEARRYIVTYENPQKGVGDR